MAKRLLLASLLSIVVAVPQAWAGSWLVQGNAGIGMPAGDAGSSFDPDLSVGGSAGYWIPPFEFGADVSWQESHSNDEYRDQFNAHAEQSYLQYGIHARAMAPLSGKLHLLLGGGPAFYRLAGKYVSPSYENEYSSMTVGVHGDAGLNYWFHPKWGVGITASYHHTLLDAEDTGPPGVYTSFSSVTLGFLVHR